MNRRIRRDHAVVSNTGWWPQRPQRSIGHTRVSVMVAHVVTHVRQATHVREIGPVVQVAEAVVAGGLGFARACCLPGVDFGLEAQQATTKTQPTHTRVDIHEAHT